MGTVGDGALCFVKDYFRRKYFLILFAVHEFKTEPLWEHQINEKMTENMTFKQTFIQFDGVQGRVNSYFHNQPHRIKVYHILDKSEFHGWQRSLSNV